MAETAEVPQAAQNIDQVKKDLIDPRAISKKIDPKGRSAIAASITQVRTEGRVIPGQIEDKSVTVQQLQADQSSLYKQVEQKSLEIDQRQKSLLVRLKSKLGIGDAKLQQAQTERDSIYSQKYEAIDQSKQIKREIEELRQRQEGLPDPKTLLEAYYEKIATTPLSNQDKQELLTPDVLASLTTEEYIALWRRLNPYFLSHVTRQGFRDHNAMIYHSAGLQEFHDGFLGVIEDSGMLRPPLALHGLLTRDETSVKKYLSDWVLQADDEEEAKLRLNRLLNSHLASAPKYPDMTAVHFAAQLVADGYYGGERSNEVFFIYPSDVLASQHNFAFNGWQKDFTKPQSETKWNDVFIWPQTLDNPGISIDAGIVFLPKSTPVDPATGSKYASEIKNIDGQEKRVMVEDEAPIQSFVEWEKSLDGQSPLRKMFSDYQNERRYGLKEDKRIDCLTAFSGELQRLGFCSEASAALGFKLLVELNWMKEFTEENLQAIVRDCGANWKRAENTIPSQQYWEDYFNKNPHLKPKHIQYYEGDPSAAVLRFQQENNIGKADTSQTEGKLLGFNDHLVILIQTASGLADSDQDPRAMNGYNELYATADKIIAEHYRNGRNTPTQQAT